MAVIHDTTMQPTKLELLARWLPEQEWFTGTSDGLSRVGGFRLDDPDGEVGIELMVVAAANGQAYLVPMTYRGAPLAEAGDALIGTAEHGVLGARWVYDGERDPVFQAQLAALLRGEIVAQSQLESNAVDPTVLVRPVDGAVTVHLNRLLSDQDAPPAAAGYVSATWRRADGSTARGIFATTA
jgi:hypothetical protein